jgi:hypothetical protein
MILKIANPLDLTLKQVELLINELQQNFDINSKGLPEFLSLDESGVSMEIERKDGLSHSYSLSDLKLLKAELTDPVIQSLKEVS